MLSKTMIFSLYFLLHICVVVIVQHSHCHIICCCTYFHTPLYSQKQNHSRTKNKRINFVKILCKTRKGMLLICKINLSSRKSYPTLPVKMLRLKKLCNLPMSHRQEVKETVFKSDMFFPLSWVQFDKNKYRVRIQIQVEEKKNEQDWGPQRLKIPPLNIDKTRWEKNRSKLVIQM